jgi:glycosyltransferase involved in cell wall biosynthesis
LLRALKSLAAQTFRDFEVIVCDDGSTEDVFSVVDSFKGTLRAAYTRIDNSGGPARPRNLAARMAKSDWISFLDSDDWWDSDRMEAVAEALGDDVDLLYHPLRFVAKRGRPARRGLFRVVGFPMRGEPLRHMALFGNPIPNSAAVVRRSLLERIGGICEDPRLVAYEDYDTWLRLIEIGARVRFLNRTLGSYWIGDDSISAVSEQQIQRQILLFERHVAHFGSFKEMACARHNYTLGSMWMRLGGHAKAARDHLLRARGLPTVAMRIKRLSKLAVLFFER